MSDWFQMTTFRFESRVGFEPRDSAAFPSIWQRMASALSLPDSTVRLADGAWY